MDELVISPHADKTLNIDNATMVIAYTGQPHIIPRLISK